MMDNPFEVNHKKINELYLARRHTHWGDLIHEIALLREALEAMEWRYDCDHVGCVEYCILCHAYKEEGHKPDCLCQRALRLVNE